MAVGGRMVGEGVTVWVGLLVLVGVMVGLWVGAGGGVRVGALKVSAGLQAARPEMIRRRRIDLPFFTVMSSFAPTRDFLRNGCVSIPEGSYTACGRLGPDPPMVAPREEKLLR